MHKKLIVAAFEKAEASRKKRGEKKPSKVDLAEDISNYISNEKEFSLGEKSFRDYYNEGKKLESSTKDISIKQIKVVLGLCQYLGFDNYETFVSSIRGGEESNLQKLLGPIKRNKILIGIILFCVVVVFLIITVNQERWMIWQDNQYVEVEFDAEEFRLGNLRIYKEERIRYFKKITPNCETDFFKDDGIENLWYGKNTNGELEYFTDLARHPKTGKSLDPITKYMIKKHICNTYK